MPVLCFRIGLRLVGVPCGLRILVGIICGGGGKFWISAETADSVDLRFLERVGAMSPANVVTLLGFEERI